MRAFVAILPPPEVVEHLDDFLSVRRAAAAIPGGHWRWSAAEQWHVTLAFAESVPERALDGLDELLARAAARRTSFGMRITGGGAFPHPDGARVLWSGLEVLHDLLGRDDRHEHPRHVAQSPRSRPISIFMISLDPAQILVTRASRQARATRYSFM